MPSEAPPAPPPGLAQWERQKVGDRKAGWAVLLPARVRGSVVLAVAPGAADALRLRYPAAVVLSADRAGRSPDRTVRWDGRHVPVRPGTVGLLVVDERVADPAVFAGVVAVHGVTAVLGDRGPYRIYPDTDRPEQIWRRGWPSPVLPSVRAQFRRSVGLRTAHVPRLALSGARAESLAAAVTDSLARRTGSPGRLVGIETAGHTVLRVRRPDGDVAVRLSLLGASDPTSLERLVADEVPAARRLILEELARGTTGGVAWTATPWLPGRGMRRPALWRDNERRWAVAGELAAALSTVTTGHTGRGWSVRWCGRVDLLPPSARDRLAALAAPLDDGVPTGWCHGDLWPANVVIDRGRSAVIDWDNASRDAPLSLDELLLHALRAETAASAPVGTALGRLVHDTAPVTRPVAGRAWGDWDVSHRAAFAAAAFVQYLHNRALDDLRPDGLTAQLDGFFRAVEPSEPEPGIDEPRPESASLVARGAVWMGVSSIVVKAAQTIVLLILAALLAPAALGLIAIGTLVTNIASVLIDLGTSTALIYWRGDAPRAARTALTIALITNIVVTAVFWFTAPWLASTFHVAHNGGADVIRGLISVLVCYGIAGVSFELMRRELTFARRVVPDIIASVVGGVVAVLLAVQGHGVASLVVGQIVQGVLMMLIVWCVRHPVVPGWHRADARGLLRYGAHLAGADLLQLILLNIDYIVVGRVLGDTALGRYSLAFRIAYLPFLIIAFVVAGAAFPYLCRLRGRAMAVAARRISVAGLTIVLPVCIGVVLFADQLQLLGTKWAPAEPAVRLLGVYALLLSVVQFAQTTLNATGRPASTLRLRGLHLVLLAVLLGLAVHHGVTAVACAQVAAAGLVTVVALALVMRSVPDFDPIRAGGELGPSVVGALVMVLVTEVCHRLVPASTVSVAGFVVVGLLALAGYAVPVWLLDRKGVAEVVHLLARRP